MENNVKRRSSESQNWSKQCTRTQDGMTINLVEEPSQSKTNKRHFSSSSTVDSQHQTNPGFFAFLTSELFHGYELKNDTKRFKDKRRKVYAFIQVPRELEKFLFYGFLQCIDAFLYFFTLLPLRILLCIFKCPLHGLSPSEKCDLIRLIVLVASVSTLQFVDTSVMYHVVRGQAIIKLYMFYNMLEIADKLMSSFGQDTLDALYWTATEPSTRSRYLRQLGLIPHLILAMLYTMAHTLLILFQATTLNVAFNSHNKALLVIMLSNNFVELKGSVFKKFAKSNLFQMACSDVRERFHYVILLSFVVVRNLTAVNWALEHLLEMIPDMIMVVLGEFFVDWFKHAFITKFNEIPFQVYKDFTTTIAYDVVRSREADAYSDHANQVSRRMGFVPLPLSVLCIRMVLQTVKVWDWQNFVVLGALFTCLMTCKLLNSIILLGRACRYVEDYEIMKIRMQQLMGEKSKSAPTTPPISLIEFNDVLTQGATSRGMTLTDVLNDSTLSSKLRRSLSMIMKDRRTDDDDDQSECKTEKKQSASFTTGGTTPSPIAPLNVITTDLTPSMVIGSVQRKLSAPDTPHISSTPARSVCMQRQQSTTAGAAIAAGPLGDNEPSSPLPEFSPKVEDKNESPKKKQHLRSECESLAQVDRYTLLNDDRIES